MDKRKIANQLVKEKITAALFQLLKEKSISEITITEIIHTAGVARASFYRNYASKENVLITLISDILDDYRKNLKNDGEFFYTYENIYMSFQYFQRYHEYAKDLHFYGYGSLVLHKLNQFHEEIAGTMSYNSIERYKLYMYMGSLYNTAMVWIMEGMKEPIEEVTDIFYNVWKDQISSNF